MKILGACRRNLYLPCLAQKAPLLPLRPSVTDATVAPPGKENLFVLIPISTKLSGDDETVREQYLQIVLNRLKAVKGIDLNKHIVYKSYGISDFKSDYHAFQGNAYGLANTLSQTALLKPTMKSKTQQPVFCRSTYPAWPRHAAFYHFRSFGCPFNH